MNNSKDIISEMEQEAHRILEAFENGELTMIEAERITASLDRKYSQKIVWEFIDVTPEFN